MFKNLRFFRLPGSVVVEMEASDDVGGVETPVVVVCLHDIEDATMRAAAYKQSDIAFLDGKVLLMTKTIDYVGVSFLPVQAAVA